MVVVVLAQLAAAFPRGEQSAGYHRLPTRKTLPPLSLLVRLSVRRFRTKATRLAILRGAQQA